MITFLKVSYYQILNYLFNSLIKMFFSISKSIVYNFRTAMIQLMVFFLFIFNARRKINCIKKTFYIFCRKTVFKTSNFFTFYAQCNTHMEKMTFFSFIGCIKLVLVIFYFNLTLRVRLKFMD